MSHEPEEASSDRGAAAQGGLEVLRAVWSARGQTSADLDPPGAAPSCKRMADVGFGGLAGEAGDLRAAWRARLAREGKLNLSPGASLADLVRGPARPRQ